MSYNLLEIRFSLNNFILLHILKILRVPIFGQDIHGVPHALPNEQQHDFLVVSVLNGKSQTAFRGLNLA